MWQGGLQMSFVRALIYQPENQCQTNPSMPLHPELEVSCGSAGVITAVTFASFGLPIGYCGNFGRFLPCSVMI